MWILSCGAPWHGAQKLCCLLREAQSVSDRGGFKSFARWHLHCLCKGAQLRERVSPWALCSSGFSRQIIFLPHLKLSTRKLLEFSSAELHDLIVVHMHNSHAPALMMGIGLTLSLRRRSLPICRQHLTSQRLALGQGCVHTER